MSAEPRQLPSNEFWTPWEGKVVNNVLPLRRFLGASGHSGVFLSEQAAENRPNVTIKFLPADTVHAETQLVQWGAATTLVHLNLVRIFDVGRYRFEGREYVYVVTEYADQTLAEILPRRALAVEEVRELLLPTLDALLFLHRKGLLHGHLKPSNFLAVDDRLKLACDTVRPINHIGGARARTSAYDPPELKERGVNAAGDIWGLGMTLLEALTQHTTAWPDDTVSFPANLPEPFASTVFKCLSIAPAARPTALDLEAQFKSTPTAQPSVRQAAPVPPTPAPTTTTTTTTKAAPSRSASAPKQSSKWWAFSITFVSTLIAWAIVHFVGNVPARSERPAEPTSAPAPAAPATNAKPAAPKVSIRSTRSTVSGVVQEAIPEVPPDAQTRIRGRIHVTVRVLVDSKGNVTGATVENPGPNKALADLAQQAAGAWKFVPATKQNSRAWLVVFVFTRNGVNARAVAQ